MQKVVKDQSYHESAILYNEKLAEAADELAATIPHPEPQRWCRSVAKQHKFHAGRHRKALNKLLSQGADSTENTEDGGEDTVLDDERTVHRSAESGQFVTEDAAEESPETTIQEHVEVPVTDAGRTEVGPDPELAAEPVDAGSTSELMEEHENSGPQAYPDGKCNEICGGGHPVLEETEDERNTRLFAEAQAAADASAARREGSDVGE